MVFDINDCDKRCWDCPKDCQMKEMFLLPEPVFNTIILNSLKACAGMYITCGGNLEIANEHLKQNAVALSIARKEYLKKIS